MPGGLWHSGESLIRGEGRLEHGGLGEGWANRGQVRFWPKATELHGEGARARGRSASTSNKCGRGRGRRVR